MKNTYQHCRRFATKDPTQKVLRGHDVGKLLRKKTPTGPMRKAVYSVSITDSVSTAIGEMNKRKIGSLMGTKKE